MIAFPEEKRKLHGGHQSSSMVRRSKKPRLGQKIVDDALSRRDQSGTGSDADTGALARRELQKRQVASVTRTVTIPAAIRPTLATTSTSTQGPRLGQVVSVVSTSTRSSTQTSSTTSRSTTSTSSRSSTTATSTSRTSTTSSAASTRTSAILPVTSSTSNQQLTAVAAFSTSSAAAAIASATSSALDSASSTSSSSSDSKSLAHNKTLLVALIVGSIIVAAVVLFGLAWLCRRSSRKEQKPYFFSSSSSQRGGRAAKEADEDDAEVGGVDDFFSTQAWAPRRASMVSLASTVSYPKENVSGIGSGLGLGLGGGEGSLGMQPSYYDSYLAGAIPQFTVDPQGPSRSHRISVASMGLAPPYKLRSPVLGEEEGEETYVSPTPQMAQRPYSSPALSRM